MCEIQTKKHIHSHLFRCRVDEPHVDVLHLPDTCNKSQKISH